MGQPFPKTSYSQISSRDKCRWSLIIYFLDFNAKLICHYIEALQLLIDMINMTLYQICITQSRRETYNPLVSGNI